MGMYLHDSNKWGIISKRRNNGNPYIHPCPSGFSLAHFLSHRIHGTGLFTYIRWKMATFKGKCRFLVGKYSLHASFRVWLSQEIHRLRSRVFVAEKNPRPSNHKMPPGLGWVPWHAPMEKLLGFLYNQRSGGDDETLPSPYLERNQHIFCVCGMFVLLLVFGALCVFLLGVIWVAKSLLLCAATTKHRHLKTNPSKPRCAWKTVTFASFVCKPLPPNAVATGKPPNLSTMDTMVFPAEVPSSVASTRWRVGGENWRGETHKIIRNTAAFFLGTTWVDGGHHNLSILLEWRCFCWTY